MDTPDKVACLADSQLADSTNKEWLLASARSSQLSASVRLLMSLDSENDPDICAPSYGTLKPVDTGAQETCASSSWLQKHYAPKNNDRRPFRLRNLVTTNYAINNHIYDNISFADSPILRSLSRKGAGSLSSAPGTGGSFANEHGHLSLVERVGLANKFRYFIACYVLFGLTLAIYSRNALSLAAVGMIASNAMNKELDDIRTSRIYSDKSDTDLGGACPLPSRLGLQTTNSTLWKATTFSSASIKQANQSSIGQLEANLRASIKQRIGKGELVDWTPGEQGLIFAAGSLGNLLIAIPLTRMGEVYGPKWIIFVASLGATVQAALMPIISPCNVALVVVYQVVFNGLTYGADCVAYTLFAHWLSPTEMAFFISCLLICYQLGSILSSFATAKILSDNLPWAWCFYTPAILCGLWTFVWMLVGASDPTKSKLISNSELHYLMRNSKIAKTIAESQEQSSDDENEDDYARAGSLSASEQRRRQQQLPHPVSWLKLAMDPNIWAICAVKFTLRWYFSVYLSLMPTYLSSVAHMSIGTIGRMSVVQSFIGLFSGIFMGYMTKSLVEKRPFNMSLATTRKLFQSIVNFGLVLSLIVFILYDCNQWVTIMTLTLGSICINFYVAAALQLPLDLSPNHCGLITSITNTLALGQTLGAPLSGLILNDGPKDRSLWRAVWLVTIVLNLISGLIFIILVDSKPRDYSKESVQQSRKRSCSNERTLNDAREL